MLDFAGPIEILGCISTEMRAKYGSFFNNLPDCAIEVTYLSHTIEPVHPLAGPDFVPHKTYSEATEQYDIILIPGGMCVASVIL